MVPADTWLGIDRERFSPGVREMCCREALHSSFQVSQQNLQRMAQLSLSSGTIRTIVQSQGRAALAAQRRGELRPGFTAADCTDQTMISGADGVMVPLVTEAQKHQRRATEAAKRQAQGRPSTARAGRPKRGADHGYKEFKAVTFYDPDKRHCHMACTAGDHRALGRLMRREGCRLQFGQARTKYAVTDGAPWIAKQYRRNLPMIDEHILDYYHLRQHVIAASHVLYEEGSAKANGWVEDMMGYVWQQGALVMLDRLRPYLQRHRKGPRREALRSLRDYVAKRVAMTDYPGFRQLGYDCGSGPTESACGRLTARLKGPGMRWDADNAEAMTALAALQQSNLWDTHWRSQRQAA